MLDQLCIFVFAFARPILRAVCRLLDGEAHAASINLGPSSIESGTASVALWSKMGSMPEV